MNNLEKYLDLVNDYKLKKGLDSYVPLYPMLRVDGNKLNIVVCLVKQNDNVWSDENIIPEYWVLIDSKTNEVIEFNKTSDNSFIKGDIKLKNNIDKQKELSKYAVEKMMQYKNYLINDIKNEQLPIQKRLSSILGNEIEVDGNKVDINEYIYANYEEELNNKINELVDLLVHSKYSSITFYYDKLFNSIILKYNDNNSIDKEMVKVCLEIMNNYYDGVIALDNLFNV